MDILRNTEGLINRYLEDFENGRLNKPEYCNVCGRKCKLLWHAKYIRELITSCRVYDKIPIRRLFCPLCKHTFALIPEFIEKFCRYGKDIIIFVVKEIKKRTGIAKIADKLARFMEAVDIYIDISTLYRWKEKSSTI